MIYLPGVSRETLRDAEACPPLLAPLVWLGVAGAWFGHVNGKDWTLRGFLRSRARLAATSKWLTTPATRAALAEAAGGGLFHPPASPNCAASVGTPDSLHALLVPDLPAEMLDWMSGKMSPARLKAFAALARKELGFDPQKLSPQDAARRLARQEGNWAKVWARFDAVGGRGCEAVVALLRLEEPEGLFAHPDAYPAVNARREQELRKALAAVGTMPSDAAKVAVLKLEAEHGPRRETLWARRGEAPLAVALGRLGRRGTGRRLAGARSASLRRPLCGTAARALTAAAIRGPRGGAQAADDRAAVSSALRAIYMPWVEEGARALQGLVKSGALGFGADPKPSDADAVVFVDGLRMDLGIALAEALEKAGSRREVLLDWRWTGFPTTTATCKPLVTPAAGRLHRGEAAIVRT